MDLIFSIVQIIGILLTLLISAFNYVSNKKIEKTKIKETREIEDNKINANVKSKARIAWMQEVRNNTSFFLTAYSNYRICNREMQNTSTNDPDYSKKVKDKEISLNEFKNASSLLSLYFADKAKKSSNVIDVKKFDLKDESNIFYKKVYDDETNAGKHQYINILLEDVVKDAKSKEELVESIKEIISIYLKVEWDKVKNGE